MKPRCKASGVGLMRSTAAPMAWIRHSFRNWWVWDAGDAYKGGFANGEREGQGVAAWASGEQYRGSWKGGVRHGHG